MRGNTIAIRIPRIKYTTCKTPKVFIKGTQEPITIASPKEKLKQSQNYIRSQTPKISLPSPAFSTQTQTTQGIQTPKAIKTPSRLLCSSINLHRTQTFSSYMKNPAFNMSPTLSLNRKKKTVPKMLSKFDAYVKEKEMLQHSQLAKDLFPEEYNENIQFVPDDTFFRFYPSLEKKKALKSEKIINKRKGLQFLLSSNNWENKIQASFIQKNTLQALFPKLEKSLNRLKRSQS